MGAIGLLAETLLEENEPAISQRLAQRIHTEAFRISRIIDDLLDLSRIESEESPPREPVLVNLVLGEATERAGAAAEQRGVRAGRSKSPRRRSPSSVTGANSRPPSTTSWKTR